MIKPSLHSLLALLLSLGFGSAQAQFVDPANFFTAPASGASNGTSSGSNVGTANTLPSTDQPLVKSVPIPPATIDAAGTATAGPRDQLVVVSPAPAGRIFGSQLFGGTFRGTLGPGFNRDYVIAIGDSLKIRLWGAFSFDGSLTVDPQGNIFIPTVGPVAVAGVKSGDLNTVMARAVRKTFKSNTEVYASLDVSQPVKVYVTGFVRQPGLYGGLASDSAITFIDKAGGVDQYRGSYVDIVVKRSGQVRKRINLYAFLLDGTLDLTQFQDGDVVVVGPRQHTFSVSGEVLNGYDFEFGEPSIPISRALAMAKVKPGATHVSILRRQGIEKRSEYYPIGEVGELTLNDGDQLIVTADRYPGTIQVRVEGAHSGAHALVLPYGATLKDVLDRTQTNPMSRIDSVQIFRQSIAQRQAEMLNVSLRKLEEAVLSARSSTAEEAGLRAKEADLVMRFVDRAKSIQPKGQIILSDNERNATLLQDGDIIVIPERTSLVLVHGEVLFPNAVSWQSRFGAGDYVKMAGGFTQGADTSKVIVIRQNGTTLLAEEAGNVQAGDEIIVLPHIESKNIEVTRSLTQILYQIAFTARVAFGL